MPRSNQALAAGGISSSGQLQATAVLVLASRATLTTDKTDYQLGGTVIITGTGWKRGETVDMILHEEPQTHEDRKLSSVAVKRGTSQMIAS